eukprot:TRINITY_DN93551_c0_g1_i1.p1 TRINITY_DN93551_c0_g1~~TRINITY_DN93551_c0_g1_i1.p1  ORF type:complete len:835 (+),score=189.98 TRINITY_DN93551_c0_g1_i1:44-2548(+)
MAVKQYVNFLHGWGGKAVLIAAAIATIVSVPFCFRLGETTTTQFSPAPGSQSAHETQALKESFPNVFDDRETLYVQCAAPADCSCTGTEEDACKGFHSILAGIEQSLDDYRKSGTFVSMTTYFSFADPQLFPLRQGYFNATASSMQAALQFNVDQGDAELLKAVQTALKKAAALSVGGWKVFLTGKEAAQLSATASAGKTIGMADGNGMIFIVLLFGWQVRSWRLTLIPVVNTIICLIVARALVYPLAQAGIIVLPSYVPNVVLFLAIALSVDYSFFHLSRFQEVRRADGDFKEAVEEMVTTGGRVVLVSGVVLMFCWLALAAFPVFGTDTLGYCASITIAVCIIVNLLLNPALVLVFEGFFSRAGQDACRCCCRRRSSAVSERGNPLVSEVSEGSGEKQTSNNCYGRIASCATACPGMVLVPLIIYALLLPAALRLFDAELTVGGIAGSSADTEYALQHVLSDFPSQGGGVPLTVLLAASETQGNQSASVVKSQAYFDAGCELAKLLQERTKLDGSAFRGVMLSGPDASSGKVTCKSWNGTGGASSTLEQGGIYAWAWSQAVNAGNSSSLITVTPPFDVFSNQAKDLVNQARDAVADFHAHPSYAAWEAASYHPMAVNVDAEKLAAGRFPYVVAGTAFVVFCIVGLRYRAALIPLKLFFTIALPIIAVLGSGVYVFQDGALDWTGIPSLKSQGGLVWINPIACTFMLIGFGLDYDIFLFSRIYATRKSGQFKDDRAAIVNAVAVTGPVITTAGCIMALAFIGMVAQHDNPFLCQMGYTMILGVLVDTFVVRTMLVPSVLAMAGKLNWWPGKMPQEDDYPQAISMAAAASSSQV